MLQAPANWISIFAAYRSLRVFLKAQTRKNVQKSMAKSRAPSAGIEPEDQNPPQQLSLQGAPLRRPLLDDHVTLGLDLMAVANKEQKFADLIAFLIVPSSANMP